jgi:sugar phosphate permease
MTTSALPVRADERIAASRTRTLTVLWITYASFYLCRAGFGPARKAMQHDLGLSALQIGFVFGAIKLGYAVGQLVNGQLTERFGARRVLAAGMFGSSAATLLLAASPEIAHAVASAGPLALVQALLRWLDPGVSAGGPLAVMIVLAFANGWFQAGGWPPCVKVASRWFPIEQRGRTMGVLGTSLTLGSAATIFGAGLLLHLTHDAWRIALVVLAALLAVSCAHTLLRLVEHPPGGDVSPGLVVLPDRMPIAESLAATLGNPRVWVLALGLFGLDAVRYGFLDWAPGHLAEAQGTDDLSAALKTAVLPLAGALGAFTSGWATDRFFDSRRAPVCALLLAGVGVGTLAYRAVVGLGAAPTVLCLALVGFCLFGAQILLVGTAAQDFARRGATAAAAGFVDFTGHVGAFSGDVVTGWILRRHGWGGAIVWWACAAFVSCALVATLWHARPEELAPAA